MNEYETKLCDMTNEELAKKWSASRSTSSSSRRHAGSGNMKWLHFVRCRNSSGNMRGGG